MGPVSFFKKLVGRGSKGGVPATEPGQAVFGSDPSDTDAQLDAVTSITLRRMGTVLVQVSNHWPKFNIERMGTSWVRASTLGVVIVCSEAHA